jgi:DNA-binding transcriptional LysR family regulator
MRLRHIEVFHAIMQVGTISGAAKLLFVTQPAVTKVLRHCEMQLGMPLFVRVKGRLHPTPEAQRLFTEVDRLHRDLQAVRRLAGSLRDRTTETVRVMSTPTLAVSVVPQGLTAWRRRFPEVQCRLATQHTREIVSALLLGECDFALSLQDPMHPSIHAEALAEGPMTAIAPAGTWTVAALAHDLPVRGLPPQLIGLPEDDPLGSRVVDTCVNEDHPIGSHTVVQTYQIARTLVESGAGMAVIDPFTAASADAQKVQRRPLAPRIDVALLLLTRHASPLSRSARALVDCIREAATRCLHDSALVRPVPGKEPVADAL